MEWYLAAMNKYADFSGRARRQEYWMYTLVYMVIYVVPYVISIEAKGSVRLMFGILTFLIALFHLLPGLAVGVRRLHDTGKSAWWLFISFVPIVGAIILLVFLCSDSDSFPNEYGPSPKAPAYAVR